MSYDRFCACVRVCVKTLHLRPPALLPRTHLARFMWGIEAAGRWLLHGGNMFRLLTCDYWLVEPCLSKRFCQFCFVMSYSECDKAIVTTWRWTSMVLYTRTEAESRTVFADGKAFIQLYIHLAKISVRTTWELLQGVSVPKRIWNIFPKNTIQLGFIMIQTKYACNLNLGDCPMFDVKHSSLKNMAMTFKDKTNYLILIDNKYYKCPGPIVCCIPHSCHHVI